MKKTNNQKSFSHRNEKPLEYLLERRNTIQESEEKTLISPTNQDIMTTKIQKKKKLSELEETLARLSKPKFVKEPVRNNSTRALFAKKAEIRERPQTTAVHNLISRARGNTGEMYKKAKIIDMSVNNLHE